MVKKITLDFFLIILVFFLDIISKIVVKNLDIIDNNSIKINSFINIDLVWNKGIAFGFLSLSDKLWYNIITIIIFIVIVILASLSLKSYGLKRYSYILVCGGALGNFLDRVLFHAVLDFIDLNYNGFHWFIFNVADIFITIGVVCLILNEFLINYKTYDKKN